MGFISKVFKTTVVGGGAAAGAFVFGTRNSHFVPLLASDPIFSSKSYLKYNPEKNPATQDFCVKKVPLSKIKPELLEKDGKLVEAFCAGVWGGLGYAFQRAYLSRKYEGPATAHQLWTREQLQKSSYEVGTQMTDHFEIVEKTPEHILVRCGDSPLKRDVRPSDGLFDISVKVNEQEGVAEFGLKSVFYKGLGKADGAPMPKHIEFLHRLYTKLWMETALSNVVH